MEVVERFLLNGVDGQSTRFGIDLTDEYATMIATTVADSRFAIGYTAMMRTEKTLYSSII